MLLVGIILGAILTNPTKEEIDNVIKTKAETLLKQQLNYEHTDAVQLGMTLFGDRIVQEFVDNNTLVKNYYLFSLVYIQWKGEVQPIGGGAFKQVWLSPKIDEKADEIINILKKL